MSTLRKFEVITFLAALVLGALFLRGWIAERGGRVDADAFARAETARADVLTRQISQSKSEDTAYRAGLAQAASAIATPQQAVKVIARYLPQPATAGGNHTPAAEAIPVVPANELDRALRDQLPSAPEYAILTPAQIEAVAKNDLACDADRHSLAACTVQLGETQQVAAIDKAEAQKYKQALVGGTIFQRVGRILKLAACGGAGAAIGAVATRGSQAEYPAAAMGAAGGVVACSLF